MYHRSRRSFNNMSAGAAIAILAAAAMDDKYGKPRPQPAPKLPAIRCGRNQPCPCGSGKKFKKCHGAPPPPPAGEFIPAEDFAKLKIVCGNCRGNDDGKNEGT